MSKLAPFPPVMAIAEVRIGKRHRRDFGDLDGLAASIADLGLLQPIVVKPDGQLIAGERRLRATQAIGWTEIPVHVVDLDAVVRGEFAENIHRKGFTPSEMAAIADALEPLERAKAQVRQGTRTDQHPEKFSGSSNGRALDKVATFVGASRPTLAKVRTVCRAADLDPEKCGPIRDRMDATGNVDRAFRQIQLIARQQEHADRTEHGCKVDDLIALAESGKRFGVIYADPPWRFATWSESGKGRSAENHYKTDELDEIMKLPVAALAADDCALFLWCTGPHIAIGTHVDINRAWGFRPSTIEFCWIKTIPSATVITLDGEGLYTGQGYSTRSNAEFCFLATKGAPARLAADVSQVVLSPFTRHSQKPEGVRSRIERLYPGPYLELYARQEAPGWTCWGDEIASALKAPPAAPAPKRQETSSDDDSIPPLLRRAAP